MKSLDLVLTYGGGPPVVDAYRGFGARRCVPIYNALDPSTHHPVLPEERFAGDLGFLGNRLPDREARVEEFFLRPAARPARQGVPARRRRMGGQGDDAERPPSRPRLHARAQRLQPLAISPCSTSPATAWPTNGFSPATRVFEAAGAGACLITDAWEGIEHFLKPGHEVLVARDGQDVVEHLRGLTPERAREIGRHAFARVIAEHTYTRRGGQVDAILREEFAARRERSVA